MSEKGVEEAEGASEQPPRLRILSGPDKGKTHPLVRGTNEVGRALTNQVPLEGEGISKVHAVITWDDAGVVVEDMGSTNKSTLGSLEEPVELVPGHRYPMEHGDVVVFGDVACVFLWQSPGSMGGAWSRRVHTAPGDFGDKTAESSLQTPMRPQTTAFGTGDLSQQDILGQLETMMQGMSNLYSIIKGDPNSPAYTRPGSHATGFSSNFGTRAHTAADHSMGMVGESNVLADTHAHMRNLVSARSEGGRRAERETAAHSLTLLPHTHTPTHTHTQVDESSINFAMDRNDLPEHSPWRQQQPNLSLTATRSVGFRDLDRAGANLQVCSCVFPSGTHDRHGANFGRAQGRVMHTSSHTHAQPCTCT